MSMLSYNKGLMTEFIGRIIIEKTGYQDVASMTSPKCRIQTIVKGIQHKKSVTIIVVTLAWSFLFRFWSWLLAVLDKDLDDLDVLMLMMTYETDIIKKQAKFMRSVTRLYHFWGSSIVTRYLNTHTPSFP